ncbi:D-3-phosphoglycerate dehydrogenase [Geosporobacter subterraneus DSM 17957]|uniref:D-3-phosphoglycerate dehydrogenase n=1 Tax=Geosporobacter subterraneus DSM 17957 TaxID=1121919 RepID=A0A1M6J6N3_9FIRM|nr:phosphoglycerate dehydrogenase [Geosporobacter subterraneus]SHJ42321.1 D-3-phosphoglycerate dehydrogenase [Geosporobacter subterraneus DSM 17957]
MEDRKKILITEKVDEEGIKLLQAEMEVDIALGLPREELLQRIGEYDGLIVRSETKVNEELMQHGKQLKVVGRAGNGIDNIDVNAATERGIIVANTPESNTLSACELSIGLLLAQARNIPQANSYLKGGNWSRTPFKGSELYNKTLGIIGLGRIGSLVATRMAPFGMKIIAYDPYISDERFRRFGAEKKETLKELLEEADFITIHTPKTKETFKMIGEEEIQLMKKGVRIVNAARGGIICEKALYDGLVSGKVASAGLDVHEQEPCFNTPLFGLDNVIVTPHIGADTVEAQQNVGITVAQQVLNALKGEIVPNAVNLPALHRDELANIKPYIELMERLGKLYYQLHNETIELIEMAYWGNIADQDTEMVTIAFVKGLLETVIKEKVNYVNACLQAKQRDIVIEQKKIHQPYNGYADLIAVKIKHKGGTFTLAGNLSTKREGKLVEIDGYEVDVNPSEHMLFIQNLDVPGVIGNIGTLLGKEKINIATMQVGRHHRGEKALMVLNIDDEVGNDTLEKLEKVDNVLWAKGIKLS